MKRDGDFIWLEEEELTFLNGLVMGPAPQVRTVADLKRLIDFVLKLLPDDPEAVTARTDLEVLRMKAGHWC